MLAGCLVVFILSLASRHSSLARLLSKFAVFAAALKMGGRRPDRLAESLSILLSASGLYYYLIVLKQRGGRHDRGCWNDKGAPLHCGHAVFAAVADHRLGIVILVADGFSFFLNGC